MLETWGPGIAEFSEFFDGRFGLPVALFGKL